MRAVKEYCCCAIPLVNAGVYLALITNLVLGLTAGILALATPSIVGAAVPAFTAWIFAIVAFVTGGIQILGLIAVYKEKSILYRRFTTLHCMLMLGVFTVAAVFIGWSGGKHSKATTDCQTDFFSNSTSSSGLVDTSKEGQLLCNIFAWVTFGVMAGLWFVLGLFEIYLYLVISGYGSSQRDDHRDYFAVYSINDGAGVNDMLMGDRSKERNDPWNSRMSMDSVDMEPVGGPGHFRTDSQDTVQEKPYRDQMYSDNAPAPYRSPPRRENTYTSTHTRQASYDRSYVPPPSNAYTQDPGPTPGGYSSYANNSSYNAYPQSHPHPAEGSFGRKTPRMTPDPYAASSGYGGGRY